MNIGEGKKKMLKYALKRVVRGYKLFLALMIGVLVATTFVAGLLISADVQTMNALEDSLSKFDYDARIEANNMTWSIQQWDEVQDMIENLSEVENLDRYASLSYNVNSTVFNIYGLEQDSAAWKGLNLVNGTPNIGANETYVIVSSINASLYQINDVISVPIVLTTSIPPYHEVVYVNLTIAGFVEVSESTAYLLHPPRFIDYGIVQIELGSWKKYNLMVADWGLTFRPLIERYATMENVTGMSMSMGYLCQLKRSELVNPYDITTSATNINDALAKIEDRTAAYNTKVTNLVGPTLALLAFIAPFISFALVMLSIPIIFISWYSSTLLSEVSYNLRRREIGLLLTKGFGPSVIKRMLSLEGVFIGLFAGLGGAVLGTFLANYIASVSWDVPLNILASNYVNLIIVVVFGMILSLWSVRGPADRASKLEPLDCLKQYVLVEETREYRTLLPKLALLFGTYKIIVWMLGVDISLVILSTVHGLLGLIVLMVVGVLDQILNFIGPVLFLYGLTKILIRGSEKFQQAIMQVGRRFFGAFGKLATRNISRNPSRNAALVFVLSLIVSYGVFTTGGFFSSQDLLIRSDYYDVGSDVSAVIPSTVNVVDASHSIADVDGVDAVTIEYHTTLTTSRGSFSIRGINATSWLDAAYYEPDWFYGAPITELLNNFTDDVVLLSVSIARALDLKIGNYVMVRNPIDNKIYQLKIIGLVGRVSPFEQYIGRYMISGSYPSYVPSDFLNKSGALAFSEPHLLIKTDPNVNGTDIEETLVSMYPDITQTDSVSSRIQEQQSNFSSIQIRAQILAVLFASVLAVVGTGLVIGLTLKEKEYETVLLGVRGFTRRQTFKVLFGEIMVVVLFAIILGTFTGFVQLYGSNATMNQSLQSLVAPRIIITPIAVLSMLSIVLVIFMAALIPVINATRLTEEKIDIVRE